MRDCADHAVMQSLGEATHVLKVPLHLLPSDFARSAEAGDERVRQRPRAEASLLATA